MEGRSGRQNIACCRHSGAVITGTLILQGTCVFPMLLACVDCFQHVVFCYKEEIVEI